MATIKGAIPSTIGPFKIIRPIGKGGMGEVYLAEDPICGRKVALKRIKPDLQTKPSAQSRFVREAKVTGFLTHPAIIPIFTIETSPTSTYYTMPFVEGETLHRILNLTRHQEKLGKPLHHIGRSIPGLCRIFLQICEAVAYTHSKGVLHRDLKPENIIVGTYGEVMILDWGLANFIEDINEQIAKEVEKNTEGEKTKTPVKIAGTVPYMAPEMLTGKTASFQTDIYALGVIFYQMLTLQLPFHRKTLAAFRKHFNIETLIDPIEMAPHRDIPHQLSAAACKCLSRSLASRYQTVEELITDLKKYVEGRPEWIFVSSIHLTHSEDWQLEENVLLAKHIAITRSLDSTSWAVLKLARKTFADNVKIEATVCLQEESQGIGFLFNIPEIDVRKGLEEGYCLWLGSASHPSHRLFRNNIQVLESKNSFLETGTTYRIRIEKIEDQIKLFIDDVIKIHFMSYLPLTGSHIGFLYKDALFTLQNVNIYSGSLNAMVNCLAVPNSFLSHRLFDLALQEYRRIGQCFPGRMEGREALFRAGLTLLEKGKAESEEKFFHLALKEFEQLFKTPGAPLEYLGKSLVYEAMSDNEEEAKCLELGLRKFPKHPLLPMLQEHTIYRMHESSLNNRDSAYRIILLAIRHIPDLILLSNTKELLDSLRKNWEQLPFIEDDADQLTLIAIQLCFWLRKIPMLIEMGKEIIKREPLNHTLLGNILFCLVELDAEKEIEGFPMVAGINRLFFPLEQDIPQPWTRRHSRIFYYLIKKGLSARAFQDLAPCFLRLQKVQMPKEDRILFDSFEIWFHLLQKQMPAAEAIFHKYPSTLLIQENSPLHFPFGTWLYVVKGPKAGKAHFGSILDTPHPSTPALPSHFIAERMKDFSRTFWWEKKELHRQLELFHYVIGKPKPAQNAPKA